MSTIGESISRIRGTVKAVNSDSFLTDRFIHSLVVKYAKLYIKNPTAWGSRVSFGSLYKKLPCVKLVETTKIAACCSVETECTYMVTDKEIPSFLEGPGGPLIRSVTSVDGSNEVYRTTPQEYTKMSKTSGFKYNKKKYYWIINNKLYFPNVSWDEVSLEGIFEHSIVGYDCDNPCLDVRSQQLSLPPELYAQVEKHVIEDLTIRMQANPDTNPSDKRIPIRS